MSDLEPEVIILSDSESVELWFCQCDMQTPLTVVQALLAIPRMHRDVDTAAISHTPPDSTVEDAQVARALYRCVWRARQREERIRARQQSYASPRRLPRLAERREYHYLEVGLLVGNPTSDVFKHLYEDFIGV